MSAKTSQGAGVPLPSQYSSVPALGVGCAPGVDVFVAGQFGELTRYVPFDLVDAVLQESGRVQRRLRLVPSRVGIYFLLALGLFPGLGYARVWDMLTALWNAIHRLPDLTLAIPEQDLPWKPDHRQHALTALPVTFTAQPTR